ncbi:Do family serine endopeptidase [Methylovirgula sp. 4M-Z18]|uniref:Do family serine endopeptidase n=1 Tax=Methylovirgula sp. 4M-Z18 TaxID=2293567 RepID=UPI000E2FA3CC|nr:Do family serine endopeptidase [Methylovirgula sp. 4M-Z18]RFB75070.1 Do family serine endopeptidase [Methylovirgula sp. 4M-Z18]
MTPRIAALALVLSSVALPAVVLAPAPVLARGPDSLADLADSVVDAVVNISATQKSEPKVAEGDTPDAGPDSPFNDLFDQFFKNQNRGGKPDEGTPHGHHGTSLGSGFVIDSAGIIITNNHVIEGANDITVIFTDGSKLKADIVGKDEKVDVAVLRVKPEKPLKAVKFGDSDKARVGDWVMAVGNPFGLGGTVTAGIVSARNRNIDSGPYDNYIQTDAAINKGNSGGPLFNMNGEVIGINTAILSPTGGSVGIGFATPANTVMPVIDQLQKFGETRRGWLGVKIQNVDDAIAESLSLSGAHGALIAGVDDKGPAKPAGLEPGDVIVKFDGKDVKDSHDLPKIVAATPVGKEVEIVVIRKGQELTKKVTLGRLEDSDVKVASNTTSGKPDAKSDTSVKKILGLEFGLLTDDQRQKYQIKDDAKGVLITNVNQDSPAAEKGLQAGMLVDEVNQTEVKTPTDVANAIADLKKSGKKTALLRVIDSRGDVRFIALAIE